MTNVVGSDFSGAAGGGGGGGIAAVDADADEDVPISQPGGSSAANAGGVINKPPAAKQRGSNR